MARAAREAMNKVKDVASRGGGGGGGDGPSPLLSAVLKITGLTADQIRKWEERYSILNITRSSKGSRRFTDKDLELLQIKFSLKRLQEGKGQLA